MADEGEGGKEAGVEHGDRIKAMEEHHAGVQPEGRVGRPDGRIIPGSLGLSHKVPDEGTQLKHVVKSECSQNPRQDFARFCIFVGPDSCQMCLQPKEAVQGRCHLTPNAEDMVSDDETNEESAENGGLHRYDCGRLW